jgi:hypothetical protein
VVDPAGITISGNALYLDCKGITATPATNRSIIDITASAVAEPTSLAVLGLGVLGAGIIRGPRSA